jgi:uncharacterized membrane protein YeaQ/YmgE (transglycosylase-associated protein family)
MRPIVVHRAVSRPFRVGLRVMPDAGELGRTDARWWAPVDRRPRSREGTFVEITGLITAIVFGAAIGGLGRLVAPGRHRLSLLVTILVGIVAAVAGTGVAGLIGVADTSGIDWTEIALQVIFAGGGVMLLSRARSRLYID